MFKFFITFDLEGNQEKYKEFYKEAEFEGLTIFIPAKFTKNEENILLPNATLYGAINNKDKNKAQSLMIEKVKSIYERLKLTGNFTVICSYGSFTKKIQY